MLDKVPTKLSMVAKTDGMWEVRFTEEAAIGITASASAATSHSTCAKRPASTGDVQQCSRLMAAAWQL